MNRNIAAILFAAVLTMFSLNELQKHVVLSDAAFYAIGLTVYLVSAGIVLCIYGFKNRPFEVRSGLPASIFSVFGAIAIVLLFDRYWIYFAHTTDPAGEVLGKIRPVNIPSQVSWAENLLTMLLAPIAEEIVFRLGMIGVFSRYMPRARAFIISTILFTIGHVYGYTWIQLVLVLVFGILLGITYLWAGLGYSILLHVALNSWPYIQENFYQSRPFLGTLFLLLLSGLIVFLIRLVKLRKTLFHS